MRTRIVRLVAALALCGSLQPLSAQPADDLVDRQVIVIFRSGAVPLAPGLARTDVGSVALAPGLRAVLDRFGVRDLVRNSPWFRTAADTVRVLSDGRVRRLPDLTRHYVLTLPLGVNRDAFVATLRALPSVEMAEPNQRVESRDAFSLFTSTGRSGALLAMQTEVVPNDPDFGLQWGLKNPLGYDIRATQAWTITTGSPNVKVAVIDGGNVQNTHPDLQSRIDYGDGAQVDYHATKVASILGGASNNGIGVAGVDWNSRIYDYPYAVGAETYAQLAAGVANSLAVAVWNGIDVVNNSWGLAYPSVYVTSALETAFSNDITIVQSNPYQQGSIYKTSDYPNNIWPWMINVGSLAINGHPGDNTGARNFTDLAAPGDSIRVATSGSTYWYGSGTSYAAPHVSGVSSLLLAANPALYNYDIEQFMKRTAYQGAVADPLRLGSGIVDAYAALQRVLPPYVINHEPLSLTPVATNVARTFINGIGDVAAGQYYCDIYQFSGSSTKQYAGTPWAWLPSGAGMSLANPNTGAPWLQQSVSATGVSYSTYVYRVKTNVYGQTVNKWVPFDPALFARNGTYSYTVTGLPYTPEPLTATMAGPSWLGWKQTGTWTAQPSGGNGAYAFTWYERTPGGAWNTAGTGASFSKLMINSDFEVRVDVVSGSESVTLTRYVNYDDGSASEGVADAATLTPTDFDLSAPVPNPSRGASAFRVALPEAATVRVMAYDALGRAVATLHDGAFGVGVHRVGVEAGRLAPGVYVVRMEATGAGGTTVRTQRLTVLR